MKVNRDMEKVNPEGRVNDYHHTETDYKARNKEITLHPLFHRKYYFAKLNLL